MSGTASIPPPQQPTPKGKRRLPYTPSSSATSNNPAASTSQPTACPPPPSRMSPTLPCRSTTGHGTPPLPYHRPSLECTPHSSSWSITTLPQLEPSTPSPPTKSQPSPHNTTSLETTSATQSSAANHFSSPDLQEPQNLHPDNALPYPAPLSLSCPFRNARASFAPPLPSPSATNSWTQQMRTSYDKQHAKTTSPHPARSEIR